MTNKAKACVFLCLLLCACTTTEETSTGGQSSASQGTRVPHRLITTPSKRRDSVAPGKATLSRKPSTHAEPRTGSEGKGTASAPSRPISSRKRPPRTTPRAPVRSSAVCRGDFSAVFTKVSPSVVGVAAGRMDEGRFAINKRGTGFAWDNRGHIVTNAHTVAEANEIRIRTKEGKVVRAGVVGLDANTDLAVLAIQGVQLVPVERGDYGAVVPGQWVAAIGNPYGMDHSITVGVISAIGRKNLPPGAPRYADFIQSDVSIFPGNSGGPLVNEQGEVIGLNTAKLGQGLSFSTRIDMVETVTERLVREGRFDRGFAGLIVRRVSARVAEASGLSAAVGARVRAVVQDGPAALAGIEPGDIILEYDGRKIPGPAALPWMIAATPPGATVPVRIARVHERLLVDLNVATVP